MMLRTWIERWGRFTTAAVAIVAAVAGAKVWYDARLISAERLSYTVEQTATEVKEIKADIKDAADQRNRQESKIDRMAGQTDAILRILGGDPRKIAKGDGPQVQPARGTP